MNITMSGGALTARHVFPRHPFSRSQDLPIPRSPPAGLSAPTYPLGARRTPLQRHLQAERAWRSDSDRCSEFHTGISQFCSSAPDPNTRPSNFHGWRMATNVLASLAPSLSPAWLEQPML